MENKGLYKTQKKNGQTYYRVSITYHGKHISLGGYEEEACARLVYEKAWEILKTPSLSIVDYSDEYPIPFDKWVSLINFRDNGMYFSNPIYIRSRMFFYYMSPTYVLKFDVDDLFYYSSHKIMKRGNHLFVADYGMQVNIASRYGIKNHAVIGKDYEFINGDNTDYRYSNIRVFNTYQGVVPISKNGITKYKAIIHIKGNFIIGTFDTKEKAAIAYNKAADTVLKNGCTKKFHQNFIEDITASEYASIYTTISIPQKIKQLSF